MRGVALTQPYRRIEIKYLVLSICFVLALPVYSNEVTIHPEENTRKIISLSQRDHDTTIIVDDDVKFFYKHYEQNKEYSFLGVCRI